MTHKEFKQEAQKMFDGQFPNSITMRYPRSDFMSSYNKEIRDELKEWVEVTIDKYKELVQPTESEEGVVGGND